MLLRLLLLLVQLTTEPRPSQTAAPATLLAIRDEGGREGKLASSVRPSVEKPQPSDGLVRSGSGRQAGRHALITRACHHCCCHSTHYSTYVGREAIINNNIEQASKQPANAGWTANIQETMQNWMRYYCGRWSQVPQVGRRLPSQPASGSVKRCE